MKEFLLVALGAVLSYLATIVAEKQRHKKTIKEEKESYLLRAKLGLQTVNSAFEKLQDSYSYRNFFEIQRIDILDSQINDIQFIKIDIEKLTQGNQERLLILLSDIDLLAKNIRGVENFCFSSIEDIGKHKATFKTPEEHDTYFDKQRTQRLIELVEMKRRIEDFSRNI